MPVDNSKPTPSRRPQRRITEEELRDIELKRIRGELSCAECRRLKLRCDKKVPCSSCVRRGCESICPCGILSAGQGTRFILADTHQLHRKISEMSNRIRALEDALAILQATVSSERHPLLEDDLLKIKFGAEALKSDGGGKLGPGVGGGGADEGSGGKSGMSEAAVKTEEEESIDALGTLTLDDKSGEVKYFGRSAGSETLLMANEEWAAPSAEDADAFEDPEDTEPFQGFHPFDPSASSSPDPSSPPSASSPSTSALPPLSRLANLFPFTSPIPSLSSGPSHTPSASTLRKLHERQHLLDLLYAYLPPLPRAHECAESYLQHATYFFRPIKRDELLGEETTLPSMSLNGDSDSSSTPKSSSVPFLTQIYNAASKRRLRQYQTYYDAGSPGSSNGDNQDETISPTQSQTHTPSSTFSVPNTFPNPSSSSSPNGTQTEGPSSDADPDPAAPHALATIFMVLALGALLDIKNPPYNAEAERYYTLGKAALSLRTVFDFPHIRTVQAVGLMATYHTLAGKKYTRDSAWGLMSLAAKLAQSIGLHRDSARWDFEPTTVQRRRSLFWEIFAADVSNSLALGRPPAIHLSYVDCEFPIDEEATLSDSQEVQYGFWRMKHTFARDIFNAVAETTLTAKSPSYSTVLDLDRKVRELSFPAAFKPYVNKEDGEEEYYSSSLSLRGFYASQHRTVTMLYLHRSFFAQAMLDHPTNPLLSPFAPSFLTAYRCASIIIKATAHQFDRCAEMAMRVWFLLYHTFSAAVIVGTVVTHSPNSTMASSALLDLGLAVELFEKAAAKSRRARIALNVLRKLKDKAVRSYTQFCSATLPAQVGLAPTNPLGLLNNPTSGLNAPAAGKPTGKDSDDDGGDELAIFGGQKRVLTRKHRHKSSASTSSTAASSAKNSPQIRSASDSPSPPSTGPGNSPSPPTTHAEPHISLGAASQQANVHPSLMYFSQGDLFGLESMPSIGGNPFTGPDASMSMGGDTAMNVNPNPVPNAMQGIEANLLRGPPSMPGPVPPGMMGLVQGSGSGGAANGGMGEMYQSFMSYLANRSFGGNNTFNQPQSPPSHSILQGPQQQQQQHQSFSQSPPQPQTQPPSGMQSRRTSVSPSAPSSAVSSPGTPWSVISALSTINTSPPTTTHSPMWAGNSAPQSQNGSGPGSPLVPQGVRGNGFTGHDLLAFAGSIGPIQRQQQPLRPAAQTGGFAGFGGGLESNMFGYAGATMGHPGFGGDGTTNGTMMAVDPREEMVEMGLTTESGMDAGWMSFMRECGIMGYSAPGTGQMPM